jgi:hypothetical protein
MMRACLARRARLSPGRGEEPELVPRLYDHRR